LASETIQELSHYGKLLLPVMTAALAAQGGITASAGLCMGTAFFDSLLCALLSDVFLPLIYLFMALSLGYCAFAEESLKRLKDMVKTVISWSLKTALTVFTTYMGLTGVVSGTTDAAALKAARLAISSFVPVVGGILSDASEAVLVSADIMKNAAGVYGIFAALSIFLNSFVKISAHYLSLKFATFMCGLIGNKSIVSMMEDFSNAMGLLIGMSAAMCILVLISTVCFMKGVI